MQEHSSRTVHRSVLLQETIDGLAPQAGDTVLDGTAGGGGHAEALCRAIGARGTLVALDADEAAVMRVRHRLEHCGTKLHVVHENFRNLDAVLDVLGIEQIDRMVLDLGLSSFQLEEGDARGFSFLRDEPLHMTFARTPHLGGFSARDIVNEWEEAHIADVLWGYGEERYARQIARAICRARTAAPIETTTELVDVIKSAVPARAAHGRIHPATRTFQALRIAVNDELGALAQGLASGWKRLAPGGRIAVISFHSLEDRIVKRFFRERENEGTAQVITKKPIEATEEERKENPRARSAKLRIAEKQTSV